MKRRTILQLSGLLGAGLTAPFLTAESHAQDEFAGPYWIFVTAGGGWDPRFLFDPTMNPEQNQFYSEIGNEGDIRFGLWDLSPEDVGLEGEDRPYLNPQRFAENHGGRMTVFNGVDTSTNNHDAGQRAITSGSIAQGVPALGALLAATHTPDKPLPFVSFGGYDSTFDVAPLSRIGGANQLRRLAAPNLPNAEQDGLDGYHTNDTYKRIRKAQQSRLKHLIGEQHLPKILRAKDALAKARITDQELKALQLPELKDLPGQLGGAERLLQSGQLALAAFQAGLSTAANLSIGGFDTHGNHDDQHSRAMVQLLTGVGAILDEIDDLGMKDKVFVVVGSDFGRTPYNGGGGKDHWPVTSYLTFGPGIKGGRVIGASDDDQFAKTLDPKTLEVKSGGVKLTPGAIHLKLRELGKLSAELDKSYPIAGSDLPLFG